MAKDTKTKAPKKDNASSDIKGNKKSTPDTDEIDLKNEVAAFAAQLGISANPGASLGDEAFNDFAPDKAQQRVSAHANVKNAPISNGKLKGKDAKKQDDNLAKAGSKQPVQTQKFNQKPAEPESADEGEDEDEAVRQEYSKPVNPLQSREWNFGVGPRPGEKYGRSLLGKEEPSVWYQASAALPALPPATQKLSDTDIDKLREKCEELLANEASAFDREMQKRNIADFKWLQQVKQSGTTADKVAAFTLQVQESPFAGLKSLDTLLSWVSRSKGGRDVVRQAIEALQELFLNVLLPDRRLKHLEQHPLAALPDGKEAAKYLLYWYLEDQIKVRYNLFITALEDCSKDNLEFVKEKSIKTMYELLVKKPEGEAKLLSGLVNKLGDPSRKLASKAGYLLTQLLLTHPVMKPIVATEVERFVFRPGLQDRARYYAVVFLNQLPLSHKDNQGGPALAKKLVNMYLTMFRLIVEGKMGVAFEARKQQEERFKRDKAAYLRAKKKADEEAAANGRGMKHAAAAGMKQKGRALKRPKKPELAQPEEMDARMLSALITGVRRAFPYIPVEDVELLIEPHSQQLYRLVHTAPFSVGVQALMLMWQVMITKETVSDRFYRALYASLGHDSLTTSTKSSMFLSLLFKAMKGDTSAKRCAAFVKRLLQAAAVAPPAFACGALLLTSEVLKAQPELWTGVLQPEDGVAVVPSGNTASVAAGTGGVDDDGDEVFRDAADSEDDNDDESGPGKMQLENGSGAVNAKAQKASNPKTASENSAKGSKKEDAPNGSVDYKWPRPGYYDINKREPMYAGAERACWWELDTLATHSHPSVAAFSKTLLAGQHIVYSGDPLKDHALVTFLDKFIAKKPKAKLHGASVMQPVSAPLAALAKPTTELGGDVFAALAETQVKPDEVFFHRFYTLQAVKARREAARAAKQAKKEKKAAGEGSDEDGSSSGDEGFGVAGDDLPEAEVDAFLEKEEVGVDDNLGDPDVGYDYDSLVDAMGEEAGSDDDDDDEDNRDADDGDEGAGADDSDQEIVEGEEDDDDAADAEGDEGEGDEDEDGEEFEEESELEDSGDDDDDDFVMADAHQLKQASKAVAVAGKKAGKKQTKPQEDEDDVDLDKLGLGVMDLPSPSDSEASGSDGDDDDGESGSDDDGAVAAGGKQKKQSKAKMEEHSFEFGDDDDDDEGEDIEGLLGGSDDDDGSGSPDMDEDDDDDEDGDADSDDIVEGDQDDDENDDDDDDKPSQKKGSQAGGKRKRSMFASADDYASMLDDFEKQQHTLKQQGKADGEGAIQDKGPKRSKGGREVKGKGGAAVAKSDIQQGRGNRGQGQRGGRGGRGGRGRDGRGRGRGRR